MELRQVIDRGAAAAGCFEGLIFAETIGSSQHCRALEPHVQWSCPTCSSNARCRPEFGSKTPGMDLNTQRLQMFQVDSFVLRRWWETPDLLRIWASMVRRYQTERANIQIVSNSQFEGNNDIETSWNDSKFGALSQIHLAFTRKRSWTQLRVLVALCHTWDRALAQSLSDAKMKLQQWLSFNRNTRNWWPLICKI